MKQAEDNKTLDMWETTMHESNPLFQPLVGKTVAAVEYVDDYCEGITLRFTDGSWVTVALRGGDYALQVGAAITE